MTAAAADLVPTEEQQDIIASARTPDPVMIQAYAGTAKTTSIALAAPQIRVPALALAFNKKIADELRPRLPPNWNVKTLNGLGHLAWVRALPARIGIEVDDRKIGRIVRDVAKEGRAGLTKDQWEQVRGLVRVAMQSGVSPGDEGEPFVADTEEVWAELAAEAWIPQVDVPLLVDLARHVLVASIAEAKRGIICFDDQTYCPTILGGKWPRYPALAVDEAQDLSPLNHRMVRLASREDGKVIVVGDSKQAIYGWRGADAASMTTLRAGRAGWTDRKLTLTFRCPKVIVAKQQGHAPGFRAAASNRQGRVEIWQRGGRGADDEVPQDLGGWSWAELRALGPGTIAILCRNNAPLLALAFKLLRQRVGVVVAGRDIGKGLVGLARKVCPAEASAERCLGLIEEWEQRETAAAAIAGHDDRVESVLDRGECLRAVLAGAECRSGADLATALAMLFARDSGDVTLSTIHRAKGLEWDIVGHVDPWRVPSKRARQAARDGDERALEQEWNLRYVAETRTRDVLVQMNLDEFR